MAYYFVQIVGNSLKSSGHVEYQIKIIDQENSSWIVQKRYRELRELHELVKGRFQHLHAFPPKKVFGNTDPDFINERQEQLQKYLVQLFRCDPTCSNSILRAFFQIPAAKAPEGSGGTAKDSLKNFMETFSLSLLDLTLSPSPLDETELEVRRSKYSVITAELEKLPSDPSLIHMIFDAQSSRVTPSSDDPNLSSHLYIENFAVTEALNKLTELHKIELQRHLPVENVTVAFPPIQVAPLASAANTL